MTRIAHIDNILNDIRKQVSNSLSVNKYYEILNQPKTIADPISGETRRLVYLSDDIIQIESPFREWNGVYYYTPSIKDLFFLVKEKRLISNDNFVTDVLGELSEPLSYYQKGFFKGYKSFDEEIEGVFSGFKTESRTIKRILEYLELNRDNLGSLTYNIYIKNSSHVTEYVKVEGKEYSYLKPSPWKLPISIEECHNRQDKGLCTFATSSKHHAELWKRNIKMCETCNQLEIEKPTLWHKCGYYAGKYYRAWCIVLFDYELFDNYLLNIQPKYDLQQFIDNEVTPFKADKCNLHLRNDRYYLDDQFQRVCGMLKVVEDENMFNRIKFFHIEIFNKTIEVASKDYHPFYKNIVEEYRDELNKLDFSNKELSKENSVITKTSKAEKKLSLKQIALKYFYEGRSITRKNADSIVKEYGFTSGEKLFQYFSYFSSSSNRRGKPSPCTPTTLKNKIALFEEVLSLLSKKHQARAKDEIKILNSYYDSDY